MNWFLSKTTFVKKNLAQNSKAKAMWPPITKKAGLQDRPFLVFSYQQDLKVLKIILDFHCCGSLVIYILPVFSTVPWKNRYLKILCYGPEVVGFQTRVIMDLWGMAFHAVVVIALILSVLFISTSTCCVRYSAYKIER